MRFPPITVLLFVGILYSAYITIWQPARFMKEVVYEYNFLGLRSPQAKKIYDLYYKHFYSNYVKTLKKDEAEYYANYYANYYAHYYTSEEYLNSLEYALPEPTKENFAYPKSEIAELRINAKGVAIIKYFEGYRDRPYLDAGGKMTIGYGHLIREGEFYSKIDKKQADEMLAEDIRLAEAVVKRNVKVPLNSNQFSALVSLVYNIGPTQFVKSTLLKKLNENDYEGAAKEFVRWKHVGKKELRGLLKRRKVETIIFQRTESALLETPPVIRYVAFMEIPS